MAEAAKAIKNAGGEILIPYLDDNPLLTGTGDVNCGSVNDQIYAVFETHNSDNIKITLSSIIGETLKSIVEKINNHEHFKKVVIDLNEILRFFNFFYIFHPIKNETLTFEEFKAAEKKIKARASFQPFEQLKPEEIPKWQKCNLCGHRKSVYEIPVDKNAGYFNKERICSVCLLKRAFPLIAPTLIKNMQGKPQFLSTTRIAAQPIISRLRQLLKQERSDQLSKAYEELKDAYAAEVMELDPVYGRDEGGHFFDASVRLQEPLINFRKAFRDSEAELKKRNNADVNLPWLERPFYAVVSMDADNMGTILRDNWSKRQIISRRISDFSKAAEDIIQRDNGQLIFMGGEDISFLVHPENALPCVGKLSTSFQIIFGDGTFNEGTQKLFTLSAGIAIAFHKYPLSKTIKIAGEMLDGHAKKQPSKNATAISVTKGHTETFHFTIGNELLKELIELENNLHRADISRTTPYRIRKARHILSKLEEKQKANYLHTLISKTRDEERDEEKKRSILNIVGLLMKFGDTETMVNALLYARFLAGDK